MDLTLSDEQRLLRESAERFVAETYDAEHRRFANRFHRHSLAISPRVSREFC
jgi:alkylation response protein AidB-like acyl-CoA dehydrogenase